MTLSYLIDPETTLGRVHYTTSAREHLDKHLSLASPRFPRCIVFILLAENDAKGEFSGVVRRAARKAKTDQSNVCVNGVLVEDFASCEEMSPVVTNLVLIVIFCTMDTYFVCK